MRRFLSFLLSVVLVLSIFPQAGLAEENPTVGPATTPEAMTEPTPEAIATPEQTITHTPEPTSEPTPEPNATVEPNAVPGDDVSLTSETNIVANGTCGSNLTWTLDSDGVLSIAGVGAMDAYRTSNQPWEGYETAILSVAVADGVTSIGEYAFYACSNLNNATISDGVTSIGEHAFSNCDSLESVVLPSSVNNIGMWAFNECRSLANISLPDGLRTLERGAFSACSGLEQVRIPASLTSLGASVFYGCQALVSIEVDADNTQYKSIDGVLFSVDGTVLILHPTAREEKSYTVPDGVTSIGNGAFLDSSNLLEVKIADSVRTIEAGAFERTCLLAIDIPNGVNSIGEAAFASCMALKTVKLPKSVTSIGPLAFSACDDLTTVYYCGTEADWKNITIDESGNDCLISANIVFNVSDSPTDDGIISSGYCGTSLTWSLDMNGRLTIAGTGAMDDYNNYFPWDAYRNDIQTVEISEGVTSICKALTGYPNLSCVSIPSSLASIGESPFYNCPILSCIEVDTDNAYFQSIDGVLFNADASILIKYPEGKAGTSYTVPNSVTSIGVDAFSWSDLSSIVIPDSVKTIQDFAFMDCSLLRTIEIPNGVKAIAFSTFFECTALESIKIPNSVVSIGEMAFDSCSALKEVYYSDTEDEWSAISIENFNDALLAANIICESESSKIVASGTCGDNLIWEYDINNTLTIKGAGGMDNYTSYYTSVPWCDYKAGMESVVIEPGVTSIGSYAFSDCSGIKNIAIPESMTGTGDNSFFSCKRLANVYYAGTEKQWSSITFSGNNCYPGYLTNAAIHFNCTKTGITWSFVDGILTISGNGAMDDYLADYLSDRPWHVYQDEIVSVVIEDGVTAIGAFAFSDCHNLASVVIPNSVECIRNSAFYKCSAIASITVPEGVTSIGNHTFCGCSGLTDVTLPDSLTKIGNSAFAYCTGLTAFTVPDSVTSIGTSAFSGCTGLTSMTVPFVGCSETSDKFFAAIFGARAYNDFTYGTYVPSSLKSVVVTRAEQLYLGAFLNCSSITSIVLPDAMTSIGDSALRDCKSLTSITIPDGVTYIGQYAFSGCSACTEIHFKGDAPNLPLSSVEDLTATAYYPCSNPTWTTEKKVAPLTWVPVHTEVTDNAVSPTCTKTGLTEGSHCSACETVLVEQKPVPTVAHTEVIDLAKEPTFDEDGLTEGKHCSVCNKILVEQKVVPATGIVEKGACGEDLTWKLDINGKLIISGEGEMASYASGSAPWEAHKADIQSVVMEEGVTTIGGFAFFGCTNMLNVTIPDSVTSIGEEAFSNCSSLEGVRIPDSVTSIETGAFYGCSSLTGITLPDNLTTIGDVAFGDCSVLESISIPDSVESIGDLAFYGCASLASVTLSDGLKSIGNGTFSGCSALESISIPGTVEDVGALSFFGCSGLTSVMLADGVKTISEAAFCGCSALKSITIPGSVESIGVNAFSDCPSLGEIMFAGNAPTFASDSFTDVTATAFYPCDDPSWTAAIEQSYGGTITWTIWHLNIVVDPEVKPTETTTGLTEGKHCLTCEEVIVAQEIIPVLETGYTITLNLSGVKGSTSSVWIDGVEYKGSVNNDVCALQIKNTTARSAVIYSYNSTTETDPHKVYPTGMYVWMLSFKNGAYTATRVKELDNILQYAGSSIRITGKKGIRMITSVPADKKKTLIASGIKGYTLLEYGTVVAWDSELGSNSLVLGKNYAKTAYAYRKGVADPVYKQSGGLVQYTNVLVGFTNAQCIPDLAMRPYIILQNQAGEKVTLYGGTIHRSIGYIAYQNRNAFKPGAASYEYIWGIIHHVYGNKYDAEYKK